MADLSRFLAAATSRSRLPVLVPLVVVSLLWTIESLPASFPATSLMQRLEWITYDWRLRLAANRKKSHATDQLAAVLITDRNLKEMNDGSFGHREKFPWPVHLYGRAVRELSRRGAEVVGFDILFELLNPGAVVVPGDGTTTASDEYFAARIREAGNIILAAEPEGDIFPAALFRTNALDVASITTAKDADGVLRSTYPFINIRTWHPQVRYLARGLELDLSRPRFESNCIVLPSIRADGSDHSIPLNPDGSLDLATIMPGGKPTVREPACSTNRIWNLGIALAARLSGMDLDHAAVGKHQITLHGNGDADLIIPLDAKGRLLIDWSFSLGDPRIHASDIVELIRNDEFRQDGIEIPSPPSFKGQLVVVGVAATGGNVTDLGTTPLSEKTPLVMQHLNVANSILTGRFIRQPGTMAVFLLVAAMGIASALLTWNLRALTASAAILVVVIGYVATALVLFDRHRYWLPIVVPILGALFPTHVVLVTFRVGEEQRERQRIRSIFSRIVSPNVVTELLRSKRISLQGEHRKVSVYFADIRGFTAMTDQKQAEVEELILARGLSGDEAETCREEQAREVLATVNLYLGVIADTIKQHHGTLDKYIGDCVMAFWGAPAASHRHALDAVRAAIAAQRAVYRLNVQRASENDARIHENRTRQSAGKHPLPLVTLLALGSGISTGFATVGLMGSRTHLLNYTVFGREVNLASRLEGISGSGRIIISDGTWRELQHLDPTLAAQCAELPPQSIKGFRDPVKTYEVKWREMSQESRDYDTGLVKGNPPTSLPERVPKQSES